MSVSIRLAIAFVGLFTLAACGDPVVTRSRGGSDTGEGAAGSVSAECYPNGTCNTGLNCVAGFCDAPIAGEAGGPCYPNGTCNGVLDCVDGRCQGADADTGTGCNQFTGEGCEDTGSQDADAASGVTCTPAPFAAEGTYLLGINIFPLDRRDEHPLLISTEIEADGSGTFTFTFQPLATDDIIADDGSRTPRTTGARALVGNAIVVPGVTIGDDRSFSLTVAGLRIVGEANSITGRDILADINLVDANFRDSNFACGSVTGQTSEPINLSLAPSTFAFQRTTNFLSATFLADNCNDADEIAAQAEDCR